MLKWHSCYLWISFHHQLQTKWRIRPSIRDQLERRLRELHRTHPKIHWRKVLFRISPIFAKESQSLPLEKWRDVHRRVLPNISRQASIVLHDRISVLATDWVELFGAVSEHFYPDRRCLAIIRKESLLLRGLVWPDWRLPSHNCIHRGLDSQLNLQKDLFGYDPEWSILRKAREDWRWLSQKRWKSTWLYRSTY